MRRFTKPEQLDGDNGYKCEACGRLCRATKQLRIAEPPRILTIHLKRFSFGMGYGSGMGSGKLAAHVAYDFKWEFAPFTTRHQSVRYALYAVLVHEGSSTQSGHYYAYSRGPVPGSGPVPGNGHGHGSQQQSAWYLFNDSSARRVSESEVRNASAYILCYERIDEQLAHPHDQRHNGMSSNGMGSNGMGSNGTGSNGTANSQNGATAPLPLPKLTPGDPEAGGFIGPSIGPALRPSTSPQGAGVFIGPSIGPSVRPDASPAQPSTDVAALRPASATSSSSIPSSSIPSSSIPTALARSQKRSFEEADESQLPSPTMPHAPQASMPPPPPRTPSARSQQQPQPQPPPQSQPQPAAVVQRDVASMSREVVSRALAGRGDMHGQPVGAGHLAAELGTKGTELINATLASQWWAETVEHLLQEARQMTQALAPDAPPSEPAAQEAACKAQALALCDILEKGEQQVRFHQIIRALKLEERLEPAADLQLLGDAAREDARAAKRLRMVQSST